MAINVLYIAADAPGQPPLDMWQEVSDLANIEGIALTIIGKGQATRSRIGRELRKCNDIVEGNGPTYDVVIWSGHGDADRLMLSDGTTVSGMWLATQIRCGSPMIVVLAACMSGATDETLKSLTGEISDYGIHCIGMLVNVSDKGAIVYNREFLTALAAEARIVRAHRQAQREMAAVDPQGAAGVILVPAVPLDDPGVVRRLATLEADVRGIKKDVSEIKHRLPV